ncbi:Dabb family protein [Sphingobacterium sp. UT-1RO-CII-1]|uniref:Dabb family protein n=1 Tax=Sphingobacterium sp. UT-1RO-CII-1 TaxID=2995225 RepID=UPI00227D0035|nr:Dabb family protein [Sphingobacterium sp. UT-1RO-CII-1]MCY4780114.1 Dabb family protein [Sphingobacterium sp. UT-1RO-CII-1]
MASQPIINKEGELLRHVVLLKFKDTSSEEQVKEVEEAFRKLPSQIKEIVGFEWGINNSPEGQDQGFTHLFFVSFETEEDRDTYLPHPAHKAFVDVLKPHLDKVLVIDYWAKT